MLSSLMQLENSIHVVYLLSFSSWFSGVHDVMAHFVQGKYWRYIHFSLLIEGEEGTLESCDEGLVTLQFLATSKSAGR